MLKAWTRVSTCIALCVLPLACGRANYDQGRVDAGLDARAEPMDAASRDAAEDAARTPEEDAPSDARMPSDAMRDAGADAPTRTCPLGGCLDIDPSVNGCAVADEGPFVEVGRYDTPGAAYGMWVHAPYVLVADTTSGFSTFTFDGSAFSFIANIPAGFTEAIWNQNADIFVSTPGTGLAVFRLSGAGVPMPVVSDTVLATEARRGWSDDSRVYIPNGAGGLLAYNFRGDVLSQVGTALPSSGFSQGVWSDGLNIYFADGTRFRVVRFDGSNFTELDGVVLAGATRVWGGIGGVVYVAHTAGVTAYTFDGSALTGLALFATPSRVRDVWSDGVHIFVAAEDAGVYALRLDGSVFAEVGHVDTDGGALGVVGDGTFLYVGDQATGIKAYTGFRCTLRRSS